MEEEIQKELQELQNLETAGSLDDSQQSRLSVLKMVDVAEKTAEQKSKDLDSALAQKEHFRTKFEELEKKQKEPNKIVEQKSYDPFEAVKLGKVLDGYDEGETDFILRNAKSKSIEDITKAVQDEMVQSAIKSRREKVVREGKVPNPSSSSGGFVEKSPEDVEKMSRDEHKKYAQELEKRQGSGEGI